MALADSFVKKEFAPSFDLEEERKEALLDEMGLTKYDVDKLQKMMLGSEEAVCAKKEELDRIRQHKGQKEHWEEFVDAKRRMGWVLHHSEIIRRLRSVIPSLIVAPGGQLGRISLYFIRSIPVSEIPGYPLATRTTCVEVPIYISWLDLGYSPEYEIDLVNDVDVAIGQRRGWRTLLLRLILRRAPHCIKCKDNKGICWPLKGWPVSVITEQQALKAFGEPTYGSTSDNYRRQLWEFRNGFR